ncbi:Molybdenum cofactor biosynthesis protein 1 [Tolypocladium paradoxum]|uniref:Molybdenum cofactor biosynthesis protein 1 n=1 Tax=Tolypocladium paradoxum TaxID=94208 RepID=A0A2S4KXE8_9HYPO|nr:Molybdenum cofactor biosynthesis protein 1 [Tolypocladium paradoxum]
MAADLIMPTLPSDQQQSRHFLPPSRPLHGRSQSYHASSGPRTSPISISDAASSLANSTPPSPKGDHARPGRPMYMPAVLRPCDEFPSKKIARCKTGGSSSDSDSDSTLRRANSNIMALASLGGLGHRLSRRSTGESAKTLDGDWNIDSFPEVTALPTRKHWKPDPESSICDDPTCKRGFSYFVRRHHCRRCGHIFCDWHSSYVLPLDQDANFNPRAALSRACNHCFQEVRVLHGGHNGQSSASTSSAPHTAPSTPVTARPAGATPTAPRGPEVAASVPRDWNWSTF